MRIAEKLIFTYGNRGNVNYRIGVIGDVHGKPCWEDIVRSKPDVDRWVFIGDYVDSFTIDAHAQETNLLKIIKFKEKNPNAIVCLTGNHDLHYIFYPKYRGSGFRPEMAETFKQIFSEHHALFQVAYYECNHLFTHAGVSKSWHSKHMPQVHSPAVICDNLNLWLHQGKYRDALLEVGVRSNFYFPDNGNFGGPIWADQDETKDDLISHAHQIVGHTHLSRIQCYAKDIGQTITYCDVLDHDCPPEFLVIEFERKNINLTPLRQISYTLMPDNT